VTNEERIAALEAKLAGFEQRQEDRCRLCGLLTESEFKSRDRAMELQAQKNEDKFESLNHENERTSAWRSDCVPKILYDVQHKNLSDKIDVLTSWMNNQIGRQIIIPAIVSLIIGVITVLLAYFLRK
jgi:uncharacterized circularly permuted ATP-grasp superfamily protein